MHPPSNLLDTNDQKVHQTSLHQQSHSTSLAHLKSSKLMQLKKIPSSDICHYHIISTPKNNANAMAVRNTSTYLVSPSQVLIHHSQHFTAAGAPPFNHNNAASK